MKNAERSTCENVTAENFNVDEVASAIEFDDQGIPLKADKVTFKNFAPVLIKDATSELPENFFNACDMPANRVNRARSD